MAKVGTAEYVVLISCSLLRGVSKSVICEPVVNRPSNEQRVAHRINTPAPQSMCLVADLRKQDGLVLAHTLTAIHGMDSFILAFLCIVN